MKKIILIIAILSGTAFADRVMTKNEREMKNVCKSIVYDYPYKGEDYSLYYGIMYGYVEMALTSNELVNKYKVVKSNMHDLVVHVCEKTLTDKQANSSMGFRLAYKVIALVETRKTQ